MNAHPAKLQRTREDEERELRGHAIPDHLSPPPLTHDSSSLRALRSGLTFALAILSILGIGAASIGAFFRYRDWNFDDSFIVFRVVRNLLTEGRWSFNPEELINSSTSVLNTLAIALVSFVSPSIPAAAHIVGALSLLAAGISVWLFLRRVSPYGGMPLLTALAVIVTLAQNSTWGLETNLFAAILLFLLWQEDQTKNSWPTLGFLILARPDGALFAGLKWVAAVAYRKTFSRLGITQLLMIVLPWCAFSLYSFGTLFPDTLTNKMWQGRSGFWGPGWIYLHGIREYIFAHARFISFTSMSALMALPYILLHERSSTKRTLLLFTLFCALQQAAYVLLNVPPYHWYFSNIPLLLTVLCGYSLCLAEQSLLHSFGLARVVYPALVGVMLSVGGAGTMLWKAYRFYNEQSLTDGRDFAYRETIRGIEARGFAPGSLATLEVGTIGFETQRSIVDLVGLTTSNPQFVSREHLDQFFTQIPALVLLHRPLYPHEDALASDPRFWYFYEEVATYSHSFTSMVLYQRIADRIGRPIDAGMIKSLVEAKFPRILPSIHHTFLHDTVGTTRCILDRVNGDIPSPVLSFTPAKPLKVTGWAADLAKPSLSATVSLVLLKDGSPAYNVPGVRQPRADVATHLSREAFTNAGYVIEGALFQVAPGDYGLAIAQGEDEKSGSYCILPVTISLTPLDETATLLP